MVSSRTLRRRCAVVAAASTLVASTIWFRPVDLGRYYRGDRSFAMNAKIEIEATSGMGGSIRAEARGGSAWTESHRPRGGDSDRSDDPGGSNNGVRISFRLHDQKDVPAPSQFLSVENYKCSSMLPPSLSPRNTLGFTTTISTDLNVLFLGDSVAQQFAQGFYSSALGEDHYGGHVVLDGFETGSTSGMHVQESLVAPARGGGAIAYWRSTFLMTDEAAGYVNYAKERAEVLARHEYFHPAGSARRPLVEAQKVNGVPHYRSETARDVNDDEYDNATNRMAYEVGKMDACVVRLPHGWMKLRELTRDAIAQHIEHCGVVSGARTVVVSTLPLNNNVESAKDWKELIGINRVIREVARGWTPPVPASSGGEEEGAVRVVLVQEFGNFTNQILYRNAAHVGYNFSMPNFSKEGWEAEGTDMLMHRYKPEQKHAPSIPMVCGHPLKNWSVNSTTIADEPCQFNMISRDGMHWCIEGLGARYSASIACLLGCVYNGKHAEGITMQNGLGIRRCEQECNNRFMSLVPAEEGWIGKNTTMYSN